MYDWNDIRIFLAVSSEGSTLAASKKLNMNQTTVSRRMQSLEQALGLTLFERDTRGYALTPQGSALIDVAGHMAAAAENVRVRAEHLGRASDGKIRVTAAHSTMNHWVLPLISSFRKLHPDIYFEANAAEHYVSLENGEADLAIRAADQIEGDTLIAKRVHTVQWGIYCSKGYLAANGMPRSIEELKDHWVLSYPRPMIERVSLLRWLDPHIDPAKVISTVDSIITMAGSIRTGNAVGVLPCVEGDALVDLVRCFTHERIRSPIWLVVSRESYQDLRIRNFMKYVAEYFRNNVAAI
ncbi:MAG TPA: LysR family transcriptional regulator [Hyphomicrobiales bacterium]|nr:LysR family transcriptional regulator [Hyphomicrobiales bacterium]